MKSVILLTVAASYAFAANCPSDIAPITATISQNFNGALQPYEWTISPTKLVNQPPSDASACGSPAYVAQYTPGSGCDASLDTQPTAPTVTADGCTYTFSDKGTRQMTIALTCLASASTMQMDTVVPVTQKGMSYVYAFTGKYAGVCGSGPSPDNGGGSSGGSSGGCGGGCAFVIIFFVGAAVYVIGMVAWNYFKLGKRGKELAPHPEFWLMIPGLIKDGAMFSFNTITSPCRKDGGGSTYTQV